MKDVFCRYCGEIMKMNLRWGRRWLYCPSCNASAPDADTEDEAYVAAMHRPRQKPLTLDEFCEYMNCPVWFESHGTYMGMSGWWMIPQKILEVSGLGPYGRYYTETDERIGKNRVIRFVCARSSQSSELGLDAYGSVWRAWATKPTAEERIRAKWGED